LNRPQNGHRQVRMGCETVVAIIPLLPRTYRGAAACWCRAAAGAR